MIVTEIRQWRIKADTKESALSARRNGEGILVRSQDIASFEQERPSKAIEQSEWPMWAKAMRQLSIKTDRGVGDVVTRVIGPETGEAFKAWFKVMFNRDCGCDGRQAEWNRKYPLVHEAG